MYETESVSTLKTATTKHFVEKEKQSHRVAQPSMTFNKAPTLSASLVAQLVKNPPPLQETPVPLLGGKICWRRDRLPTPVFLSFSGGSDCKESACNVGGLGLVPELVRSSGEGNSYSLQYSGLENSMDRGAWQATVHGVPKS